MNTLLTGRRRFLFPAGVVALVVAVLWLPFVVPRVERLPGGIDDSTQYEGTFTTWVNPTTGASLTTPIVVPLRIERSVLSLSTGASVAVLAETVTATFAGKTETLAWEHRVDRTSMKRDPQGAYTVNLPFDMSSAEAYPMFKPETGTSYPLTRAPGARMTSVDGLRLTRMAGTMPSTPVTAEQRETLARQGLPMELSPAQVAERLKGAGIDIAAAAPVLRSTLTQAELDQVLLALTKPVPLRYSLGVTGDALIEHRTGMIVAVRNATETTSVAPDFSGAAPVMAALQRHAAVPQVQALLGKLQAVATAPAVPVFAFDYDQTPASIAERVSAAKDALSGVRMVEQTLPIGIAVVGLLLLLACLPVRRPTEPGEMSGRPPAEEMAPAAARRAA